MSVLTVTFTQRGGERATERRHDHCHRAHDKEVWQHRIEETRQQITINLLLGIGGILGIPISAN